MPEIKIIPLDPLVVPQELITNGRLLHFSSQATFRTPSVLNQKIYLYKCTSACDGFSKHCAGKAFELKN